MKYGYIRVSTKDQHPDRQLRAMQENGVKEGNIYVDYMSGKDFDRPQYRKMMKRLKPQDVIVIKSIDRLGRNYEEILEQWRVHIGSCAADTRVCVGDGARLYQTAAGRRDSGCQVKGSALWVQAHPAGGRGG